MLKRPLLLASRAERFDDFTRAVSAALAAVIRGGWQALTSADAPSQTLRRLRQLITVLVPTALLAGAGFALPMMLDLDDAAAASARTSLLVAALLALIASISPESQKATAVIRPSPTELAGADPPEAIRRSRRIDREQLLSGHAEDASPAPDFRNSRAPVRHGCGAR